MNTLWERRVEIYIYLLLAASMAWCVLPFVDFRNDAAGALDGKTASTPVVEKSDLIGKLETRAKGPEFREIVRLVEETVGSPPEPLWPDQNVNVGVTFRVDHELVEQSIIPWQCELLGKECYLFRLNNSPGMDDATDRLALVPTADVYEVIRLVGTSGNGFRYNGKELTTTSIIGWLKELGKRQPLQITGIGADFIEGQYLTPVKNPDELAERIYKFCPDIVDQRNYTVKCLADELRDRQLCFWWD